jgi:signal transduction histidine kinase
MVNNAIDAIGNNGKIALNAVQDEKNVTLTIADNGSGIDIEYLDKIFIPFFYHQAARQRHRINA